MNLIHDGRPLDVFWGELFYLNARLKSNPKTVGLALPVEEQLATYDDLLREDRSVRGMVIMSEVQAKAAEDNIKSEVLDLYMLVLAEVKKNRKDERYTKLIKVNESVFVRYNFSAKKEEVMRMKSVLKQTIYDDAFRDRVLVILDRILSEVEGAMAAELDAEEKRAQHRVDVKKWKDQANAVRLHVYAELIQIGGDDAKSWARGFFPKKAAVKKLSPAEMANKEEARAKKRMEKTEKTLKVQQDRLAKAKQKVLVENAKADLDTKLKGGAVPEPPVPAPPVPTPPVPALPVSEQPVQDPPVPEPPVLVQHEEPAQA